MHICAGKSSAFLQHLICFLLKTFRLLWSQTLMLWIAMYCRWFHNLSINTNASALYISYLKYDFCFSRPFMVNIYSKWNRNYKSYQWNSFKKRREKLSPSILQKFMSGGLTACSMAGGTEQALKGCFWYVHPRARIHPLPTPAYLLFYRVCYLWQPVEVIAILLSYMLIHLHQKGRQKFECANHHYPVIWVALLNVHFVCRCFATVPYQQMV